MCARTRARIRIVILISYMRQHQRDGEMEKKCILTTVFLREKIFRSRVIRSGSEDVWNLGFGIFDIPSGWKRDNSAGGERTPRVRGLILRAALVYSQNYCRNTATRREKGTEEWNDRVMPDCRLLFQPDKPDPGRIHPARRVSPISPNRAYTALRR